MELDEKFNIVYGYQNLSDKIREEISDIAEGLFDTGHSEDQIPIEEATVVKMDLLTRDWLVCVLDEKGNPISWVMIVPTQKELAKKFINKEISEKELFVETEFAEQYDALYLCSAITIPEFQKRGLVTLLTLGLIQKIPHTADPVIFSWPTTVPGKIALTALSSSINSKILIRD